MTCMTELTIGELSERSGVAASAIRYYEDLGLVSSRRTTGNQRRYERPMLRRLSFIRTAQLDSTRRSASWSGCATPSTRASGAAA